MNDIVNRAIAIVGLGAILPDAPNAPAYWQNIKNKRYSIIETPPERWSIADYYDPDPSAPDKTYSKIGAWVRGFEFDWKKYRVPPKVAAAMDEAQQWAVTIAAEALADYGYPDRPLDTERTGVIMGTAMGGELHYITNLRINFPEYRNTLEQVSEFSQLPANVRAAILAQWHERFGNRFPEISEDTMPGELPNIVAGRIANVLNLRGPSFITDAACASSFAAINAAVELLTAGQVDAVLTGGVDRNMGASVFVKFCKIGALSATGSRPFGDGADGFVMGEGSGAFLLKRLADAERDGDKIYAVLRGLGGSSDGKGKGITAPNPIGQILATQRAWENAGLDPATATLIEAHGTSTKVGDVVELESLGKVFGGAARGSIALGSAKSNIGHLKAGAGAAGLLKAVMSIHDKVLPPTLHAERPNPNADFTHSPFFINHDLQEWPQRNGLPRRAGVSAYGFGGTNFHVVLEEYVPGMLSSEATIFSGVQVNRETSRQVDKETRRQGDKGAAVTLSPNHLVTKSPLRGILALGAATPVELKDRLDDMFRKVQDGWTPPIAAPDPADLSAPERLVIDFGDHDELLERIQKARKALGFDNPAAWKALMAQGMFRGSGKASGKIAFLFPGQGSQYANMGRELAEREPAVKRLFAEADRVMTPILGRPLTDYIFIDANDPAAIKQAEFSLMQTAITQPAMLTMDTAIYELLAEYGIRPDMAMGHSLGEYGALIAAGIMHFDDALMASAARGREMTAINNLADNGWMAAVLGPLDVILATLKEVDGYVIPANINSYNQVVIGGASKAVEQAINLFNQKGMQAMRIPVSHAFHTSIVAPASKPLRGVLDKLEIRVPKLPLVANVTGDIYPTTVEGIKDILEQQVAATVQWVKGLETLYAQGCRMFVEVGPKKALKGFVDDVLGDKPDVISLFTNHPKFGELPTFNQALCGLYAAGYGAQEIRDWRLEIAAAPAAKSDGQQATVSMPSPAPIAPPAPAPLPPVSRPVEVAPMPQPANDALTLLAQAISNLQSPISSPQPYDRNETPLGSVVVSGTGLGLPGAEKPVMDPDNALRILRGEQFIDLIPERFRHRIQDKRITRVVKAEDGGGSFQVITDPDEVIKLAGRPGSFDLEAEYGVPGKLIEALDTTTQLAMAAGFDALREAGIPLIQTYKTTSIGTYLPDRWLLPVSMRDETGVIFASAFPGGDRFAEEISNYFAWQNRIDQLNMLEDLRQYTSDPATLQEIARRIADLREQMERQPYFFDRRFLFRILSMGHSQFAEYIGARGPNTQVNAACASTAQAVAIAEDWIRAGRCRRVIVLGADNVTSDHLIEWVGAGFLATGAAATDNRVDHAALPFDKRRHGTILGMGACALVVESEDAVRERGMRGIVELLSSESSNSAFHGTRLDVEHIGLVMENLVAAAERRFGLNRYAVAPQMVFMSHETFTPARGGSASAEVIALRKTFGEAANDIIVANTKGFTGHPMGVGVEDVIAIKSLEYGIVPPVPNFKEVDPDLGVLNLSRGGRYPVQYALHLAAGFGSQIAMTLTRRIPGGLDRIDNKPRYQRWLADISGNDNAEIEVVKRILRIKSNGGPGRAPIGSNWQYGIGPSVRCAAPGDGVAGGFAAAYRPAPMAEVAALLGKKAEVRGQRSEVGGQKLEAASAPAQSPVSTPMTPPPPPPAPVAPPPPVQMTPAPAPAVAVTTKDEGRTTEIAPTSVPSSSVVRPSSAVDPVVTQVLALVAAKTGYPEDMLELELDLEADLGIDTVKQAETFAAIRESFNIPLQEGISLRDYPTLASVVGFVRTMRPDLGEAKSGRGEEAVMLSSPPRLPVSSPPPADPITPQVLGIVAAKTGYPQDMLDLDLDLEADLGIDTVKQAETFAAIRESFNIPLQEGISLRDYPTLASVVGFVRTMRPDLGEAKSGRGEEAVVLSSPPRLPASSPPPTSDPITPQVLAIVAAKTGYPQDMLDLDLDLEADLGIDTVKQAETFAAIRETFGIPFQESLSLRDYPTLASVVGFVRTMRPDLAEVRDQKSEVSAAPAPTSPTSDLRSPISDLRPPTSDPITPQVLSIVAAKTGYPQDMLDLDLDLEADLGIDTVKQAETFAAIRETFGIPFQEGISLRDYPTLASVVGFVRTMRSDLAEVRDQKSEVSAAPAPTSPTSDLRSPISDLRPPTSDPITPQVLSIVAAKTGYPEDMLELELDLEADLGIDTVKQAETFAAIRETFGIPFQEGISLRDYPTLASVVGFVRTMRPDLGEAKSGRGEEAVMLSSPPRLPASSPPPADPITPQVLSIVAAKTGYPEDMLELELDLEADLGIDTVKQAETFAAIRETFGIPFQEGISLRDYPTLASVVGFVRTMRPDLERLEIRDQRLELAAPPSQSPISNLQSLPAVKTIGTLDDADKMPRRAPVPSLRPAIDLCKPTGVSLGEGGRVVVMMDRGGVGKSLVNRLEKLGVTALTLDPGVAATDLDVQLKAWLADGPIQGVYWLPALDVEPGLEDMDLATWRELNRQRVKNLYTTMRALYESVRGPGSFLVSATRLGGLHGYGAEGATAPLGGAVTGFSKAYNIEQNMKPEGQGLLVKAVDFEVSRKTAEPAGQLIAETLFDPGAVEIGYHDGLRFAITLVEKPAKDGNPGMALGSGTVFVVTGAAGGITSAIVTDLAVASRGVFYLLDLVPCPARDDENVHLFRTDKEALKAKLIDEARGKGEKPTPKQIDQQIIGIERSEAALRAVETAEAAGATVHYHALDLRDGEAVGRVVADIRARYGKIDVLLHAGGLLIDRTLPNKEPNQFDLVFDVKADGFFSLLKAAKGLPIAATVSFSSVAGRFGNNGQSDYSSANDLLCKISSSMRTWRPDTRGIAIDWTAWGQIGMAARGSVPQIMEALGVDMLPPEAGVPTIRRELTYGGARGEIVVAGRLGAWLQERDPSGGLDPAKAAAALAARSPRLLMAGEIKAAKLYGGIEVETALDPRQQPFLFDHMPDPETPWLPGIMATETLAEVASLLAPGHRVVAVENEEMMGAFKFFRMEPRTLYLNAQIVPAAGGDLIARVTLRSVTKPAKEGLPVQVKEHFTADVRLCKGEIISPLHAPTVTFTPPADLPITATAVYERFFHGPAYQVIEAAQVAGNQAVGRFSATLPANTAPADAASLMAPRLVELCFQLAALWHQEAHGAMAFPLGFRSVAAYRQEADAAGRLYGIVATADEGETFDCQVVDESGAVFVELNGYRTVARPV